MAKRKSKPTGKQSIVRHHSDWMRLVERSGPFLSMPVLLDVFPQGLTKDDRERRADLRERYESWQSDSDKVAVHRAWIKYVLTTALEVPEANVADTGHIPQTLQIRVAEHHETLKPDMAVIEVDDGLVTPRMLVMIVPPDKALDKSLSDRQWKASPHTRMSDLVRGCNDAGITFGLVTNGEQWTLVYSRQGETASFTTWYASIWFDEPITLRAFRDLLSARRFFGDPGGTLDKLYERSANDQQEVTDQLGLQVREAIETLVEAIDRIDRDRKGALLKGYSEAELYEACVTLMMRLVFLFYAEERRLLPVQEAFYQENYSVLALVDQLQAKKTAGEELLEYGGGAWSRILALFRAMHAGVQHDDMQLPAYGGSLFDPDRYSFLEGRRAGTKWREVEASPLPINDRTMLHVLEALQFLVVPGVGQGERVTRRLSFRELGVEDIGHIYESLLDHTAKRADGHVLGLVGSKDKEPEVALSTLEEAAKKGRDSLVRWIASETGRAESAVESALDADSKIDESRLLAACGNDGRILKRVTPFANLVRTGRSQDPVIIPDGGVYVTAGSDRRSTGTHYTPRSLTEPIVRHTLEPLVYHGPADGAPKDQWKLKNSKELLGIKICDMACGSGAFLVQACRYLSELLVESWEQAAGNAGGSQVVKGLRITPYGDLSTGAVDEQLIPLDTEERLVYARRLLAQRCLYGVDKNPLAVEMAKLSLWLLTLAKDKPFTFLDHCIRAGDSLVGITSIDQLLRFSLDERVSTGPLLEKQRKQIENRLHAVKLLRSQIEQRPSNTPQDIEYKATMLKQADEQTRRLTYAADMLLAESWQPMGATERKAALNSTLVEVEYKFKDLPVEKLDAEARERLSTVGVDGRFHWPLEFPEVFNGQAFDAFLSNPPFLGGKRIVHAYGDDYRTFIKDNIVEEKGAGDLCVYFYHRALTLIRPSSCTGFIATSSIAEGDTLKCGPQLLLRRGAAFYRTIPKMPWPGTADVEVALFHFVRGQWKGNFYVNCVEVGGIGPLLTADETDLTVYQLASRKGKAAKGVTPLGAGFVLSPSEAQEMIAADSKNRNVIKPYIVGMDFNRNVGQRPSRFVIDFGDWDENEAAKYKLPFQRVHSLVKPERDKLHRQIHETCYWKHWDRRSDFFASLPRGRVLLTSLISKHWALAFVPHGYVYDQKVVVFSENTWQAFTIYQSIVHEAWGRREGGLNLGPTPSYTVSANFNTFPIPSNCQLNARASGGSGTSSSLAQVGETLHEHRRELMEERKFGLTDAYNCFHDSGEAATDVNKLRNLHIEMDQAVAAAYGWDDFNLGHGFHTTKQGKRFTISESARREVLQRLLKLNHERFDEEVKRGLHDKKGKAKKTDAPKRRNQSTVAGPSLFGDDDDEGG